MALLYVRFRLMICPLLIRQSGALNATPTFGPLAIPVFLDKLTAGSRATKVNLMFSLSLFHTEIDHR